MRVVILGTGALGSLFAARLAAVAEVWMLGTWREAIDAVNRDGLRVEGAGGHVERVRIPATADPTDVPPADLALLLVKSYQTPRAAAWAGRCLAPGGVALTLQNGLDNAERIASHVDPDRILLGVTFEGATVLAPGHVRHAGRGATCIGPYELGPERRPLAKSSPAVCSGGASGSAPTAPPPVRTGAIVEGVLSILEGSGFDAHAAWDAEALLWGKAVVNAAINPLSALWRIPNGELLASEERRCVLADLAREAAAVAAGSGVRLPYADPVERLFEVCRATAANRSSMLQDVERGRRTEIGSINGYIVRTAKRVGVPAPWNETVLRLVSALEPEREQTEEEWKL